MVLPWRQKVSMSEFQHRRREARDAHPRLNFNGNFTLSGKLATWRKASRGAKVARSPQLQNALHVCSTGLAHSVKTYYHWYRSGPTNRSSTSAHFTSVWWWLILQRDLVVLAPKTADVRAKNFRQRVVVSVLPTALQLCNLQCRHTHTQNDQRLQLGPWYGISFWEVLDDHSWHAAILENIHGRIPFKYFDCW